MAAGEICWSDRKDQSFTKWFADWDKEKSGSLTEANLREGLNAALPQPNFGGGRGGGNGGPGGNGGFGGGPGGGGQSRPLTPEQVGFVRTWIDQGAK